MLACEEESELEELMCSVREGDTNARVGWIEAQRI